MITLNVLLNSVTTQTPIYIIDSSNKRIFDGFPQNFDQDKTTDTMVFKVRVNKTGVLEVYLY
jgi:hypothetical protein